MSRSPHQGPSSNLSPARAKATQDSHEIHRNGHANKPAAAITGAGRQDHFVLSSANVHQDHSAPTEAVINHAQGSESKGQYHADNIGRNRSVGIQKVTVPPGSTASRRNNGAKPRLNSTHKPGDVNPTTTSRPVLVRSHSAMDSVKGVGPDSLDTKQSKRLEDIHGGMPPLEAFSFEEILAAIDPEIRVSIDTIAEICGRSKMSLANEYDSHLPPQADLSSGAFDDTTPSALHHPLLPVNEAVSGSERSPEDIGKNRAITASWAKLSASMKTQDATNVKTAVPVTELAKGAQVSGLLGQQASEAHTRESRTILERPLYSVLATLLALPQQCSDSSRSQAHSRSRGSSALEALQHILRHHP